MPFTDVVSWSDTFSTQLTVNGRCEEEISIQKPCVAMLYTVQWAIYCEQGYIVKLIVHSMYA